MSMSLDRSTTLKPEEAILLWYLVLFSMDGHWRIHFFVDTYTLWPARWILWKISKLIQVTVSPGSMNLEQKIWCRLAPKHGKSGNTTKRMSFVLSFDTKLGNKGFLMVRDALDFLLFSMKKRAKNPVGILLLDHLKDHAQGLYNHLMNGSVSKDLIREKLTNNMDAQFIWSYSISSNDWLNHFMVDYDIICILKDYVGYTSWSDVPLSERGYCYCGYNAKTVLPE